MVVLSVLVPSAAYAQQYDPNEYVDLDEIYNKPNYKLYVIGAAVVTGLVISAVVIDKRRDRPRPPVAPPKQATAEPGYPKVLPAWAERSWMRTSGAILKAPARGFQSYRQNAAGTM
jgi:hypothetical protein